MWLLDYRHNRTAGIGGTDVFEIADAAFDGWGEVRITITIQSSSSPITVTPSACSALTAGVLVSIPLSSNGRAGG